MNSSGYQTQEEQQFLASSSSSQQQQLQELRDEEDLLQKLLESKSRRRLIEHLEADLEMENLRRENRELSDSLRRSSRSPFESYTARDAADVSASTRHLLSRFQTLPMDSLAVYNKRRRNQQQRNDELIRSHLALHEAAKDCPICQTSFQARSEVIGNLRARASSASRATAPYNPFVQPNVIYGTGQFQQSNSSNKFYSSSSTSYLPHSYRQQQQGDLAYTAPLDPSTTTTPRRNYYAQMKIVPQRAQLAPTVLSSSSYDKQPQQQQQQDDGHTLPHKRAFYTDSGRKAVMMTSMSRTTGRAHHNKPWTSVSNSINYYPFRDYMIKQANKTH